jgi:hypothetical protein
VEKRHGGRPLRTPEPGEGRVGLSLRVTPETKAKLDQLALHTGRSLSQEVELLIEQALLDRWISDPRAIAVFHQLGRTAEFVSGGRDWLTDYGAFNEVIDAWMHDLQRMAPEQPPEVAERIADIRSILERAERGEIPFDQIRVPLDLACLVKALPEDFRRELERRLLALAQQQKPPASDAAGDDRSSE